MEPTLVNGVVILRRPSVKDIDEVFQAVRESLDELQVWMPWATQTYCKDDTKLWVTSQQEAWDEGIQYSFAITDCETGRFLGGAGLNLIRHDRKTANLAIGSEKARRARV